IESTLSKTDWDAFELALERGDWSRAADLVQWERLDLDPLLRDTLEKAAEANSDYISQVTRKDFRYDLKDPNALQWITDHGAELVTEIDEPTQKALQEVIYRGYFSGYTPRQQAEIIQGLVGLTPGETERLEKMAADLAKDGFSQDDISRIIGEEAAASRKRRAAVIAVNETSEAANRGQYFTTKDAVRRGIIDPSKYEGYRIITPDDRLCDTCAANAGEARPLPDGVYPSTGSSIAKVHTSCRCCEGYRLISKKEGLPLMTPTSDYKISTTAVTFESARIRKTESSIFVPTIPIVEGVFWGHGFPVLRRADKFGPEANWLEGIPILINHQPLDPDARRVGQLRSPKFDPEGRRVAAITEFFRRHLTPEESEGIESGGALNGSLYFACYLKFEEGVWTNPKTGEQEPYEAVEEPHYVFFEYSLVKQGVVTPEDGAGFNIESGPSTLAIAAESIRRKETGGSSMEIDPKVKKEGEMEGTVDEASEAKKPSPTPATAEKPTLEERFAALEATITEEREARKLAEFRECLKPGCESEADELYKLSKTDPVTFAREHGHKLIGKKKEHAPSRGVPVVDGVGDPVAEAKKRADDKILRRS
ncbi:MAG: hypothetical protein WBK88_08175, partial [Methanothrix sp.]